MVRVGHPLVICEVSSGSPQGAEGREREKPCRLSIDSIAKVGYTGHVFFSTPMKRDTRLATEVQQTPGFIKTVP